MKKLSVLILFAVLCIIDMNAQSLVLTCDEYGIVKEDELTGKMYQDGSSVQQISVIIVDLEANSIVIKAEKQEEIKYNIMKKEISEDGMNSVFLAKEPSGYLLTVEIDLTKPNVRWISLNFPKNGNKPKSNKVYHVISIGTK
ncbi:MAG TPA: hypothetical protein VJ954_07785 [Ignavibacteriaceae bacterium]|nr:hypothetical protein [Ignavibacteriaceae bacterium]